MKIMMIKQVLIVIKTKIKQIKKRFLISIIKIQQTIRIMLK